MATQLHNLTNKGRGLKKRKTIGRGNASGHGTYSTRGAKGQRARSGGRKGLKLKGLRFTLLRLPKFKGIKSLKPENQIVRLVDLNKKFVDGDVVNVQALKAKGLVKRADLPVKILNIGEIKKKLTVQNCFVSVGAKEKIEATGGRLE
jgi:large subunit ribosomal protein L15